MVAGKKERPEFNEVKSDLYITVDASAWGWGAVIYDEQKLYKSHLSGEWHIGNYDSSVRAEPQGIEEVIKRIKNTFKDKTIAFLTDHDNIVNCSGAMFIHNYYYNKCLESIEKTEKEQNAKIFLFYLEGVRNTADAISRGKAFCREPFPEIAGTGLDPAYAPPWQV